MRLPSLPEDSRDPTNHQGFQRAPPFGRRRLPILITRRPAASLRQLSQAAILAPFLLAFLLWFVPPAPVQAARAGGSCSYADFPGKAAIISVTPIPQPEARLARLPYQPHRVVFVFTASVPVPHGLYKPGRAYELTLSGGAAPGPEFLKKYGIRPGASYPAELHLITSGTCSPVVFTFRGIDVYDHFEMKR